MHQIIQRGLLALATSLAVAGAASAAPPLAQVGPLHAALGSAANAQAMGISKPIAVRANAVAVSRPLADIAREQATVEFDGTSEGPGPVNPFLKKGPLKATELQYADRDGAISEGGRAPNVMPPTIVNFEGMNNTANGQLFGFTVSPPDTNGDIGRTHYVQTVNLAVQVFNINGSPLTAPFKMSGLFAALGASSLCSTDDDGDPIVLYDHLADRWMISQFALTPPFHQCIAISQTGDPTGAYFVYDFVMPNNYANDYPHFGVWPDAYYMTDNEFNSSLTAFTGAGAFAFDRAKMLVGDPTATYIYFDQPAALGIGGQLPSDLDGPPPPVGAGNIFAMFTANEFGDPGGDGLRLWEFKPNFATPASSTFTELTSEAVPIPVAAFNPLTPAGRGDVPQPGTTARLDTISDRLMFRLQYRNFGAYETLAVNHTVNVGADTTVANYRAGVRYYELRRTGGAANPWTIREQATHAPADNVHRWMGSTALDRAGNQAVGFSTSAATVVFPSVTIAGRLVGDPLGGLAQGESTIAVGSRVQTSNQSRWGDYSMLGVDPVDDCTFWFTSEYYTAPAPALCAPTSTQCWQTRIASFRFPTCAAAPLPGTIQGRVTNSITGQAVGGAVVRAGNGYAGTTDSTGNYSVFIPGGTFNMATIKTGYSSGTATGVVVPTGGRVTQNFQIQGIPILNPAALTFTDTGVGGNGNGIIDIDECVAVSVPATNEGGAPATATSGTLSSTTPNLTVPTSVQSYGTIGVGATASPAAPFVLQTGTNWVPGTSISALLNLTATEGNWSESYTLPTGSPAGAPVAFAATGPVAIPDASPVGATLLIPVAGLTSPVSKVTVSMHITHTFVGDLQVSLISPNNTTVVLSGNRGGAGDNFGADCPAGLNDTRFDDAAATSITSIAAAGAPFANVFRPEQPLAGFAGTSVANANGNWRLFVVDTAGLDVGNIECVTIDIDGYAATSAGCSAPLPDALFANGFETP